MWITLVTLLRKIIKSRQSLFFSGCFIDRFQILGHRFPLFPGDVTKRVSDLMNDTFLNFFPGKTASIAYEIPMRLSTEKISTSASPRFLSSLSTMSQYLADSVSQTHIPRHSLSPSRLIPNYSEKLFIASSSSLYT